MKEEERYFSAIKKLDIEKRGVVIGILKEIKKLKENGFDERDKDMLLKVTILREVLGI